jgi:mRNA interferase MazF
MSDHCSSFSAQKYAHEHIGVRDTTAQARQRTVLVLSNDVFNDCSGTVIAVALPSQEPRAAFPLTLELIAANLPKRSWVKISQIRTLSVERIGRRLGRAAEEELATVLYQFAKCLRQIDPSHPPHSARRLCLC